MPIELKMPALSPTMEKGTLARWLVAPGDPVLAGDVIAEIETDKAAMEFGSADEGRISRLLIQVGTDDVPVGTTIALLVADEEPTDVVDAPAAPETPVDEGAPKQLEPSQGTSEHGLARRRCLTNCAVL